MGDILRIKELANSQGISLSSLCKRIGKTRTYLSEIYNRGRSVPNEYVPALAEALHTTPEYLMGETDDPGIKKEPTFAGGHSPEAIQFANEFSDLTQEDWHKLREYADFLKSRHTDK